MPEFLTTALTPGPPLSWGQIGIRLVVALALGRVVALVYNWTRFANERTPSIPATLVLLSVLIAMVTQVIGDNAARAFALVGALSIVRFRTVVRDTVDTAFVIFAVVIGMAVGSNHLAVALTGMVVVTIGSLWMKPRRLGGSVDAGLYTVRVRVGLGQDLNTLIRPVMEQHLTDWRLLSIGTAKQGLALEAAYEIRLRPNVSAGELVKALNRTEGVQNVDLVAADLGDDDD
jgi:hypothetical protein